MSGPPPAIVTLKHLAEWAGFNHGVPRKQAIAMFSGFVEDEFSRNEEKAEELHFLPKPFGLKQLVAKVKDVLSGADPVALAESLHETGT